MSPQQAEDAGGKQGTCAVVRRPGGEAPARRGGQAPAVSRYAVLADIPRAARTPRAPHGKDQS